MPYNHFFSCSSYLFHFYMHGMQYVELNKRLKTSERNCLRCHQKLQVSELLLDSSGASALKLLTGV